MTSDAAAAAGLPERSDPGPAPRPFRDIAARFRYAARVLATFILVPLAAGTLLGPQGAGWAACTGAAVMLGAALANGQRAARRAAPVVVVGFMVAAATTPGWGWAVTVAALAAFSGIATRWAAGLATSLATMVAVSAPSLQGTGDLLIAGAYVGAGCLYGLLAARFAGAPATSPTPVTSRRRSIVVAVALGTATFTAAAIAVSTGWEHATWMVAAVVVLGIPTPGLTQQLMVHRLVGQVIACTIVGVLAALTESTVVMLVAAVVVLMLYLMSLTRSVVEQVTYLSAFFMLPVAASYAAPLLVVQRLAFNLMGLALLLVVVLVVRRYAGEPVMTVSSP